MLWDPQWCSYKVSLKQDTEAFQGYDSRGTRRGFLTWTSILTQSAVEWLHFTLFEGKVKIQ